VVITPDTHVADVAIAHPATVRVFQQHGIDFCCGGKRPLSDASDDHGVALAVLLAELESALETEQPGDGCDWRERPLAELIAHIVSTYHQPQREELPRLAAMMAKVLSVHGDHWPQMLRPLAAALAILTREADAHTDDEETRVFPAIVALESGTPVDLAIFEEMRADLEQEHAGMGALLAEMKFMTNGFAPPAEACTTFRALFAGLQELTETLHNHVHLENHILFPRAGALAADRTRKG
jgi:regulator of cell morphogenesis and NO signaling